MATPAMSALIRRRSLYGGLIMSASHNPAGPKEDWGIKFNYSAGEPAPEKITDEIFKYTESVSELLMADIPDVDLSTIGVSTFGDFEVEVVSPTEDYFATLKEVRSPSLASHASGGGLTHALLGRVLGRSLSLLWLVAVSPVASAGCGATVLKNHRPGDVLWVGHVHMPGMHCGRTAACGSLRLCVQVFMSSRLY